MRHLSVEIVRQHLRSGLSGRAITMGAHRRSTIGADGAAKRMIERIERESVAAGEDPSLADIAELLVRALCGRGDRRHPLKGKLSIAGDDTLGVRCGADGRRSRKRRSTYWRRRGSGSGNPAFRHCGQSTPPTLSSNRCTAPIGSQAKPISTRSAPRPAMPRREGFGLAITGETNSTIGLIRAARRRWIGSSGSGSPLGKTPIWASRSAGSRRGQ